MEINDSRRSIMLRTFLTVRYIFIFILMSFTLPVLNAQHLESALIGRWDLTVQGSDGNYPSWLEVSRSGNYTLIGRFVGRSGSVRPISEVTFDHDSGSFSFTIPPQWENRDTDLYFEGTVEKGRLKGWTTNAGGDRLDWTAVRAPDLRRESEPEWGEPIQLLNRDDLSGWNVLGTNNWKISDGTLKNSEAGGNLVTEETFTDFKLHVEFRYPEGSNSGIYLRGRYEVQVEDNYGMDPGPLLIGSVYGFLPPSEMAAKKAGEWQTYDITLTGRMISVTLNGKEVICNREIPGITGGALDSNEGEPGPIMLQGDHGPVEYRNITLTPAN